MNDHDRYGDSQTRRDYGDLLREGLLQEKLMRYEELDYTYTRLDLLEEDESE